MMLDKDHLNAILKICGTPDAEFMSKIDSEDVRIRVCICYAVKPSNNGHFDRDQCCFVHCREVVLFSKRIITIGNQLPIILAFKSVLC